MDFSISPEIEALQARTRRFIDEVVVPYEAQIPHDVEGWAELRRELQQQARATGLFLPQLRPEWGGLGLNWRDSALIFEEAGRSLLGPHALNCAAPDEGNMHMMNVIASPAQKEKYLRPLAGGEIRSCFSMTEPAPGAGADPSLLKTYAEKRGDRWVLNGQKWYITGALGAAFTIAMARTDEVVGRHGATMFLVDTDNPGFRVIRKIKSMDEVVPGGHCEVEFVDCEVAAEAVLGEVNKGFDYAQVRLGPARLTHCMRWTGAARRAMEYATAYALTRQSFGETLANQQAVQWMMADSEIELHAARLMIWQAAWLLDQGQAARHETSMAKVFVGETVNRVVDRAVQICGALGISEDIPVSRLYRDIRPFRIYDGPSEVHRYSIARRLARRAQAALAETQSL
jgi:acyl-CoA dehydrogenase